jgi:hypothetical protein
VAEWSAQEVKLAPEIARLEQERHARIATAEKTLADYNQSQVPVIAKKEADRAANIKAAETAAKALVEAVAPKLQGWEPYVDLSTEWIPLDLEVVSAKGVQKLEKQPDKSLLATAVPEGPNVDAVYTLRAPIPLKGITGIKIEALPDVRLPANGPGLSQDGNFVLTEFAVSQVPAGADGAKGKDPAQGAVKLLNPKADFEQKDFSAANSINGNRDVSDRGWAVAPKTGEYHQAVFEFDPATPASDIGGMLAITMQQGYQRQRYQLGRFKISVTTAPRPLRFGASQALAQAVRLTPDKRSKEQQALIRDSYLLVDAEYQKAQRRVVGARKPLPADPKVAELQGVLAEAQKPVVLEPRLVQLRRDAELSQQQMANQRLTAAQDLAWALINSPAFLFNY